MAILPALAMAAPFAASLLTNIWNAREARKNRDFQERMSSTAHQREVRDLRSAGINPMMSRMGSGASTPGGDRAQMEDMGKGVSSALQVAMLKADIDLKKAQAQQAYAGANQSNQQAQDIWATQEPRIALQRAQAALASGNLEQVQKMMPELVAKAREEVQMVSNSARAAEARAVLDEAAATGAGNIEEFERSLGQAAPWARALFQALRLLRR